MIYISLFLSAFLIGVAYGRAIERKNEKETKEEVARIKKKEKEIEEMFKPLPDDCYENNIIDFKELASSLKGMNKKK